MNTKAFNRATAFFRNMQLNDANDSRWGEFADAMDEVISTYVPIVRCKNCKHRPTYPETGAEIDGKWCYWCELHRDWKHDDWFCADGEKSS